MWFPCSSSPDGSLRTFLEASRGLWSRCDRTWLPTQGDGGLGLQGGRAAQRGCAAHPARCSLWDTLTWPQESPLPAWDAGSSAARGHQGARAQDLG